MISGMQHELSHELARVSEAYSAPEQKGASTTTGPFFDDNPLVDDVEGIAISQLVAEIQRKLGALITRPKLTGKLLSRPPVKFLYDIVSEVSVVTGFGELFGDQQGIT
ncbi:hypothetical protein FOZ62_014420, partial [Perkinsus olseni]